MQRLAVLTTALGQTSLDPDLVYEAMKDRVHQPYRRTLVSANVYMKGGILKHHLEIPGLPEVTSQITPKSHPGLLGICLSGAGPTILALATHNFEAIAESARTIFALKNIQVEWKLLEVVDGSEVQELN